MCEFEGNFKNQPILDMVCIEHYNYNKDHDNILVLAVQGGIGLWVYNFNYINLLIKN